LKEKVMEGIQNTDETLAVRVTGNCINAITIPEQI
jgi:hypothetical protein